MPMFHGPSLSIRTLGDPLGVLLLKIATFYNNSKEKKGSLVAQMVKNPLTRQDTPVWSLGREDPLEEEMATHSSILGGTIPWTEEPGGLQSIGLQSWTGLSSFQFFRKRKNGTEGKEHWIKKKSRFRWPGTQFSQPEPLHVFSL